MVLLEGPNQDTPKVKVRGAAISLFRDPAESILLLLLK